LSIVTKRLESNMHIRSYTGYYAPGNANASYAKLLFNFSQKIAKIFFGQRATDFNTNWVITCWAYAEALRHAFSILICYFF